MLLGIDLRASLTYFPFLEVVPKNPAQFFKEPSLLEAGSFFIESTILLCFYPIFILKR